MTLTADASSAIPTAPADHPQVRLYRMMARVREFELLCQRLWNTASVRVRTVR